MKKVKMYSTPTCPHCIAAKEFFKTNNVQFEDINLEKNPEAIKEMEKKSGQRSVPVIEIDGTIVVGFDEAKISKLLGLK